MKENNIKKVLLLGSGALKIGEIGRASCRERVFRAV